MNELIPLFLNNLLPILLASGAGYALSRFIDLNPRSLSQVIFYIFSPCLIFTLLIQNQLENSDVLLILLFSSSVILLVGVLTYLAGKAFKLERTVMSGVLLTSMFMNAGNFGLPLVMFAFGESALGYASICFVASAILINTIGVVAASMGSTSFAQALINLLKIPTVYALILAVLFLRLGWTLPLPLERTVTLLGNASIPCMLVLMGLQFRHLNWSGKLLPIALSSGMRLLAAPAIALLLAPVFSLSGPAYQAGVIQAAMPSAVLATVVATEYNVEPTMVTAGVFISTMLSPFTLTPLLAFLGA